MFFFPNSGQLSEEKSWKRCVKQAGLNSYDSSLRLIASSMYVTEYFPAEAKEEMLGNYVIKLFIK